MQWNLRLAAAGRGIWKANELRRLLAERGLVISTGKMSGLWSARPASVKLADLDVICAVLGCAIGDLLVPETDVARHTWLPMTTVGGDWPHFTIVDRLSTSPTVHPNSRQRFN